MWLIIMCVMIFSMVVVGGITRLTHSGLSIAEWKPVTGILPPLNEQAWEEMFATYRSTPEYLKINHGMSLAEFQSIFFWEYTHRLLGRLIAVVFVLPYLFFLFRGKLKDGLGLKLFFGLLLGSLEGPMGWFMVKSGLVDAPHVSHYRLAAHLTLAFLFFAYLFRVILHLRVADGEHKNSGIARLQTASLIVITGVCLEVLYGAFTAGLKAGFGYNTFPTMNGFWIPPDILSMQPSWLNFFENRTCVQFVHRAIGFCLFVGVLVFRVIATRFPLNHEQRWSVDLLTAAIILQGTLGVLTLVYVVPITLAVIHQAVAFLVFALAIFTHFSFSSSSAHRT